MDKIFDVLDLKRWILLFIPFLIIIFSSIYISNLTNFRKSFSLKSFIGEYNLLTEIEILKRVTSVDLEVFDLFNLTVFEEKIKLKPKEKQTKEVPPPNYKIELIYIRNGKKYVVINGKILTEGSKISDKEYIAKIEKDGILLNGYWGARWIKF